MGGMACVGISSLSLANMAESDSRPFALLMSATCRSIAVITHSPGPVSALNGVANLKLFRCRIWGLALPTPRI